MAAAAADEFRHFIYADLYAATAGFASGNSLGAGGFGEVFSATLPDGTAVAIKRIREDALKGHSYAEVRDAFLSEARLMGLASQGASVAVGSGLHWPLLPLLGICKGNEEDVTQMCLVTPLMAKGNLASHIGLSPRGAPMTGRLRAAAALDAARGVAALHSLEPERLLHRDIKLENVLLDGELRAYVADYGLSRLLKSDQTSVGSFLHGTPGYVAPETVELGRYSEKVRRGMIQNCPTEGSKRGGGNCWSDFRCNE